MLRSSVNCRFPYDIIQQQPKDDKAHYKSPAIETNEGGIQLGDHFILSVTTGFKSGGLPRGNGSFIGGFRIQGGLEGPFPLKLFILDLLSLSLYAN